MATEAAANIVYATSMAAAEAQRDQKQAQDQADYLNGAAGDLLQYVLAVAPVEASAIVNAAGGDPTTATVAQAWVTYDENVAMDYQNYMSQTTGAWISTVGADLTAWQQDVHQDASEDAQLWNQLAGLTVTQVGSDGAAATTFAEKVTTADVAAVQKEAGAEKLDMNQQAAAFVALVDIVGPALVQQVKDDTAAAVKWVKSASAQWDSETQTFDGQVTTETKAIATQWDTDAQKLNQASESEMTNLVAPATTDVHTAAVAHQTYEIALAGQQATDANDAATQRVADVTAEPDSDFTNVTPGNGGGNAVSPSTPQAEDPTSFWSLYKYYLNPLNNSNATATDTALGWLKGAGWVMAFGGGGAALGGIAVGGAAVIPTFMAAGSELALAGSYAYWVGGPTIVTVANHPLTWGAVSYVGAMVFNQQGPVDALPAFAGGFMANPNSLGYASSVMASGATQARSYFQWDSGSYPKPPNWNNNWQWMAPPTESDKNNINWRWYDPEGGEWRFHFPDKYHPDMHWDYNPWNTWNSQWQNVPISDYQI